jgi:hypothetical protein
MHVGGEGPPEVEGAPRHLLTSPMLGTMLMDLLYYYSKQFHPYEHGVSVLLG